jgi:prevent-host-death family protein
MRVGIRELKAHLSQYIDQARKGEPVVITDHGKPVVRLEPVVTRTGHEQLPAKLRALIEEGKVVDKGLVTREMLPKPLPPLKGDKTLSDLIIEERDEFIRRYERAGEDSPQ